MRDHSEMDHAEKSGANIRGAVEGVRTAAYVMRHQMTPAESALWEAIRNKKVGGLRFRAQHPVGRFILDFYCPSQKLAIEVDGAIHDTQVDYDQARTDHLAAYGYRVLRFSNDEVMSNLAGVIEKIASSAKSE